METLDKLYNSKSLTVGENEITIKPLKIGQLAKFAKAIKPVMGKISGIEFTQDQIANLIVDLMIDHSDNLLEMISIATKLTKEQVEDLDPDVFLEIVAAIIEVNSDFFIRKVLPMIAKTMSGSTDQKQPGQG